MHVSTFVACQSCCWRSQRCGTSLLWRLLRRHPPCVATARALPFLALAGYSRVNSPPSCVVVPHRQHLGGGAGATGLWYTGSSSSSSPCDELLASCGTGGGGGGGRTAAAASSAWLCASHSRLRSAVYRRIDSSSSPSGRKRDHFSASTAAYAASTPVFVSRASRCARSAVVSCGLAPLGSAS